MSKTNKHVISLGEGPADAELNPSAKKMDDLSDVDLVNDVPTQGDILAFDGSAWVPNSILKGGTVGQILVKQSSNVLDAKWVDSNTIGISMHQENALGFDYIKVDDTSFRVDGIDVTRQFYVTQAMRVFVGSFTIDTAEVVSSTFAGGNTTVVIAWDTPGSAFPSTVTDIVLIGNRTGWSRVASNPFTNTNFNDIASGYDEVSQKVYWVLVGDLGKVLVSSDRGNTWAVAGASPTTDHIIAVCYQPDYNQFYFVTATEIYSTLDFGVNWTLEDNSVTGTDHSDIAPYPNGIYLCDASKSQGQFRNASSGGWIDTVYTSLDPRFYTYNYYIDGSIIQRGDILYPYIFAEEGHTPFTVAGTLSSLSGMGNINGLVSGEETDMAFVVTDNGGVAKASGSFANPGLQDLSNTLFQFGTSNMRGIAYSAYLDLVVVGGEDGKMGYSIASNATDNSWVLVGNGFGTDQINSIHYDETDKLFIACGDNGAVCRSIAGIS